MEYVSRKPQENIYKLLSCIFTSILVIFLSKVPLQNVLMFLQLIVSLCKCSLTLADCFHIIDEIVSFLCSH